MNRKLSFIISNEHNNKTVNDYLRQEIKISGSLIKRMKRTKNAILLNGNEVFTNHIIKTNDRLDILVGFDDDNSENIPIRYGELDIVYEDEDLLIIDKPASMPIHPSMYHYEDSVASLVMGYYAQKGQSFVFRCVNRLDNGTSGLCVIAKHAYAHEMLKHQLHSNEFERKYLAIAKGTISTNGFVEAPIARENDSCIKRTVAEFGDYAYTSYKVIKNCNDFTLVELTLKTGRTHQIRVHLSYIDHALLGDFLYGEETDIISRTALHSSSISLIHPISKKRIEFISPLPYDMQRLIDKK